MKPPFDATDSKILSLLQANGRITNAEIAKRVGLSPPSALQRVRRLEKRGFIKSYAALLYPEAFGLKVTVFAMISLSLHQDQPIESFRQAVHEIPEIVECYHVSGEFDFLLKILVPDIAAYEALIREKISRIEGIRQITSSFVLGQTKHTTQLPI